MFFVGEVLYGDWIRSKLDERGWTQADLARRANLDSSIVSMLISGRRGPGIDTCKAIAHALELPETTVLRAAGLLEPVSEEDEFTEELLHILDNATPEQRQQVRDFARFILGLTKI